ncbi:MAG: translation initiation factor IF-3 [Spirochaetota bacterium]|nr:translation initiation factor IF-3 [Spirochaetota bacterium]
MIEKDLRINKQIRVPEIRLIDDEGNQLGVVNTDEALKMAEEKELDLVEISPQASPPVCKVLDYGKFKFDQKKRLKEAKKKQARVQLKEIKMRPKIDSHDYDYKKKHIEEFLAKGDKVKITLQFRGREMAHIDLGEAILARLKEELKDSVTIEREPKLEGRQMIMIVAPAK